MSPQQIAQALQEFVSNTPACQTLVTQLSADTEIGVVIGERLFLTLRSEGGKVQVLSRKAHDPILLIHAQPLAVEALIENQKQSWQQITEIVAKQLLSGALRVERTRELRDLLQAGLSRAVSWADELKTKWR